MWFLPHDVLFCLINIYFSPLSGSANRTIHEIFEADHQNGTIHLNLDLYNYKELQELNGLWHYLM